MKLRQKLYISTAILALAMPTYATPQKVTVEMTQEKTDNISQLIKASNRPEFIIVINGKAANQSADKGAAYMVPKANRVMVPTRIVAENMGFKVDWDQATQKVTISNGKNTIVLGLNSKTVYVNGVKSTIDAPTEMKNNRIYVPVRFVSEVLGSTVDYNSTDKVITITTGTNAGGVVTPPTSQTTPNAGFVGIGNMVEGQTYKLDQLVTNLEEKRSSIDVIAPKEHKWDTTKITVKKGNFGDVVSGLTIKSFGWDCVDKLAGAFEYTGSPAYDPRVIFFKGNEILRIEKAIIEKTVGGKTYYLFGDGLNRTSKDMIDATHVGFAVPYQGEILIIQKPSNLQILNV